MTGRAAGDGAQGSAGWGRSAGIAIVAVAVAALVLVDVRMAVFSAVVLVNLTLGGTEAVPISRYGMFASPSPRAWTIRVEEADGSLVAIGALGVPPGAAHKRFARLQDDAVARGLESGDARVVAAGDLAERLAAARTTRGVAGPELHIVLVDWELVDGAVETTRQLLAIVPPA